MRFWPHGFTLSAVNFATEICRCIEFESPTSRDVYEFRQHKPEIDTHTLTYIHTHMCTK